ncbi:Na(+)/H(+) antiporter subunit C [Frankia sp. CNm7]|uniref:Na(+)/H(+) antiporter subunit C n=1 Tax=Frankia nepalensis TaxID=1836974 RepID=A0A937RHF8_9ACTN|nr:Na(+)/H(+) antiporter subunit C [Frankia nepalensis]MBL7498351.1 Na(+)/H(+) antiporter subunit C [Frankia nepalensis]MBL7513240.1 Na(+)/H(+) antiporter subunit C [Frankia nepalensis]MBL7518030.1 Na(+)/H(+) antiporter subunit C [Frankia nepalensis]MBL7628924.1 Na(+)/H(+) antiporter subunit C [Frankia nepalensis]
MLNLTSTVTVAGLYTAGTYLLLQRALMRVLIGIVLLGHATNLLLLLVGGKSGRPAMSGNYPAEQTSDPLPQAMALTSIVITFALTTFLLALAYRSWTLLGSAEVRDDVEDHRIQQLEERLEAQYAHHLTRLPHLSHPRDHPRAAPDQPGRPDGPDDHDGADDHDGPGGPGGPGGGRTVGGRE